GSIASNAYGEFRVTNDLDLILLLDRQAAGEIIEAFPANELYCPPAEVIETEAARPERAHFNLIHHDSGFKADVYVAVSDRFQSWALQRRREIPINDTKVAIAPPEYVI